MICPQSTYQSCLFRFSQLESPNSRERLNAMDYCKLLARINTYKAVALIVLGVSLVWGGLFFYPFTGMLEGYLTRITAGMTAGTVLAIQVALVILGGYLALEAFLILLQLRHYSKLLQREFGVAEKDLLARPL
jgi:hypothetical protein